MGTGSIGAHVARTAAALDIEVIGLNSNGRDVTGFARCHSTADRLAFAQGLDYLVALLPETPATDGLVDTELLGVMGEGSLFINAGRGNCVNESDLLLVFGASFSNHTGISAKKPIIQVDFDPMTLGKFHPVALPVLGEIGLTAEWLWQTLPDATGSTDQRAELAERWQIWREEKSRRRARERGRGMNSAVLFHALSELVPADAVIAVDVGNNTYSFGRYFECRGQRVLMSGYLGSIGFGFPAAMGAWAATRVQAEYRGRRVISISGDGGFGQYMAELTTAVRYGMNLIHVLLNNNELGKISKEQRAGHWPVWQTALSNPNFAAYAADCGGLGIRVESEAGFVEAMQRALACEGPALIVTPLPADQGPDFPVRIQWAALPWRLPEPAVVEAIDEGSGRGSFFGRWMSRNDGD